MKTIKIKQLPELRALYPHGQPITPRGTWVTAFWPNPRLAPVVGDPITLGIARAVSLGFMEIELLSEVGFMRDGEYYHLLAGDTLDVVEFVSMITSVPPSVWVVITKRKVTSYGRRVFAFLNN